MPRSLPRLTLAVLAVMATGLGCGLFEEPLPPRSERAFTFEEVPPPFDEMDPPFHGGMLEDAEEGSMMVAYRSDMDRQRLERIWTEWMEGHLPERGRSSGKNAWSETNWPSRVWSYGGPESQMRCMMLIVSDGPSKFEVHRVILFCR